MKKEVLILIVLATVIVGIVIFKKFRKQMKLNKKGKDLIKSFEAFRANPYLDSAGVPTIGYGFTHYPNGEKVTMQDMPLTKIQANFIFDQLVQKYESAVNSAVVSNINQNQFNALVSFCYNVGIGNFKASTLLKLVNENPKNPKVRDQFLRWVNAGGHYLAGLYNRRVKEADLYYKPTLI